MATISYTVCPHCGRTFEVNVKTCPVCNVTTQAVYANENVKSEERE